MSASASRCAEMEEESRYGFSVFTWLALSHPRQAARGPVELKRHFGHRVRLYGLKAECSSAWLLAANRFARLPRKASWPSVENSAGWAAKCRHDSLRPFWCVASATDATSLRYVLGVWDHDDSTTSDSVSRVGENLPTEGIKLLLVHESLDRPVRMAEDLVSYIQNLKALLSFSEAVGSINSHRAPPGGSRESRGPSRAKAPGQGPCKANRITRSKEAL